VVPKAMKLCSASDVPTHLVGWTSHPNCLMILIISCAI